MHCHLGRVWEAFERSFCFLIYFFVRNCGNGGGVALLAPKELGVDEM